MVAALATAARLLLPEPVGFGDRGDAHALLCNLGLRRDLPWGRPTAAGVTLQWRSYGWPGSSCGAAGTGQHDGSSQLAVLRLAKLLNPVFGFGGGLDLRSAGIVAAALVGLLLGMIAWLAPGRPSARVVLVCALWLGAVDRGVAGFYLSGLAEPAAILGLLALIATGFGVFRSRTPSVSSLVAFAVAGLVTLTSMPEMVALLPVVVAGLLWRPAAPLFRRGDPAVPPRSGWRGRSVGLLAAGTLALLVANYVATQPRREAQIGRHDQVFRTILPLGSTPRQDLRRLGIDPSLAPLEQRSIFDETDLTGSPAYQRFQAEVRWTDVVRFYVGHPLRLVQLGRRGVDAAASYQVGSDIGSYAQRSGRVDYAQESRIGFWSSLFQITDAVPAILAVVWGGTLVISARVARRSPRAEARTPAMIATGALVSAGLLFWAVLLRDGLPGMAGHMLLVDLLIVWSVPLCLMALFGARRHRDPVRLPPAVGDGTSEEGPVRSHRIGTV